MRELLGRIIACAIAIVVAHSAGAWTLERNFNKGVSGRQVGKLDGFDSASGHSVYANDVVYEGPYSARLTIEKGKTGWGWWGGLVEHPKELKAGDEVWLRVRTFFPAGFDYFSYAEGNRLKFLRVHTAHGKTKAHEGYNDVLIDMKSSPNAFIFGFEGQNWWKGIAPKSKLPAFDTWETYELYIKFHPIAKASGGEAVIRFWQNGELLGEINDRKTLVSMNSVATRSLLFTYWNGGAPKTQSMWVDDIVVTSDRPGGKDAHGNSFIGLGVKQSVSPPAPPTLELQK